uniref:Protein kinase domain-containing protein n=1 Tax=Ascaris lumbricoides TaxID=6252 RepID=A0A0M3HJ65_ASCLU
MTLFGPNLMQLRKNCRTNTLTASTVCRVGIHALYAIKQVHEIGYVHRDIKPGISITILLHDSENLYKSLPLSDRPGLFEELYSLPRCG